MTIEDTKQTRSPAVQQIIERGRLALANQRKATQDEEDARKKTEMEYAMKNWSALCDAIVTTFGPFLPPDDVEMPFDWSGRTKDYRLVITVPGCVPVYTDFSRDYNEMKWSHTIATPRWDDGTFRIPSFHRGNSWLTEDGTFCPAQLIEDNELRNHKYANTIEEALALAEEEYERRNKLLLELEESNPKEEAEARAKAERRASKRSKTTEETLIDCLKAMIRDQLPE